MYRAVAWVEYCGESGSRSEGRYHDVPDKGGVSGELMELPIGNVRKLSPLRRSPRAFPLLGRPEPPERGPR